MLRVLIFIICLFPLLVKGQSKGGTTDKNAQKYYSKAGEYYSLKDYAKAILELEEAIKADSKFLAAYQQKGDLHRRLGEYPEALSSYQHILQLDPNFHTLTYYGLAESEFNTGNYQNALNNFTKYLNLPGINAENKKKALKYISNAEFSINALKSPVAFDPKNLGPEINSAADEYLPAITADEESIIFTRLEDNNEDFFRTVKKDGKWEKAFALSNRINSPGNEGAQCISPDGNYLFFTACDRPDGLGRCDIYLARWEGKEWSEPFNIGAPVNTSGWESQPSISADGRTLYFVSTRSGGLGGYDIWKSELGSSGWSTPQNLGPSINTADDEQSPFIHPDGVSLYFSSNGWPGFGNKDLFLSRKSSSDEWLEPVNLGSPINTFNEESGLSISTNGRTALYASRQAGGFGGLDLYSFVLPEKLRPQLVNFVKGRVLEEGSAKVLLADVRVVQLESEQTAFEDYTDPVTGTFLATLPAGKSYALNVSAKGYLFRSLHFKPDSGSIEQPFNVDVELKKIAIGSLSTLNNVFFETNKYELLPQSKAELNILVQFLQENPVVAIEIAGHTDNVGEADANMELSEKRAKSVYDYLLSNKIAASRLSFKGYGETQPVISNDDEEGRRLNRRTEFKITKI